MSADSFSRYSRPELFNQLRIPLTFQETIFKFELFPEIDWRWENFITTGFSSFAFLFWSADEFSSFVDETFVRFSMKRKH